LLVVIFTITVALGATHARGGDADSSEVLREEVETLRKENALLRLRVKWLKLLLGAQNDATSLSADHYFGPTGLRRSAEHLRGIRLEANASKENVRGFVAAILAAASAHRTDFCTADPEVRLLRKAGRRNLDVLIEPLVCLPNHGGALYLVAALNSLVGEADKALILGRLGEAPSLMAVVLARGWVADARPLIAKVLSERSPGLPLDWVVAAAQVARPEDYDDLRFQLSHTGNPLPVWRAIRDLPGMEPLDDLVELEWRRAKSSPNLDYRGRQLAVIAAHYGHLDALNSLARKLEQREAEWWNAFQELTGFGRGREDSQREADALAWFNANRDRLTFNSALGRYVLR